MTQAEYLAKQESDTAELYIELDRLASAGKSEGLPTTIIGASELMDTLPVWKYWQMTERRFLPFTGGLLDQPVKLLNNLLALDGLLQAVKDANETEKQENQVNENG